MKCQSILIIVEQPEAQDLIGKSLESRFTCFFASTTREALALLRVKTPTLVLIDTVLPGLNGAALFKNALAGTDASSVPIIWITGTDTAPELMHKINASLAKTGASAKSQLINFGNISLDSTNKHAFVCGAEVPLGMAEFHILKTLIHRAETLVKREELELAVWGSAKPLSRALDPHLVSLRKKLSSSSATIRTERGKGYLLENKQREHQ